MNSGEKIDPTRGFNEKFIEIVCSQDVLVSLLYELKLADISVHGVSFDCDEAPHCYTIVIRKW